MPRSLGPRCSFVRSAFAPLADPRDEILVHDVARDPAAGQRIANRSFPRRDRRLHVGLALVRHAGEVPGNAQRVLIVDRHAIFRMAQRAEAVRPQANASDRPALVRFIHAFDQTVVGEAVLELVEPDAHVFLAVRPGLAFEAHRPVAVHPLEVHGVDRVFLTLQPVARDRRKHDLHEAVLPQKRFPVGNERRRLRAEVCPQHAALRFDRIRLDANLVAEVRPSTRLRTCLGIGDILERLLDAAAGFVELPAVIVAPNPAVFDEAVARGRRAGAGNAGRRGRTYRRGRDRARDLRPSGAPALTGMRSNSLPPRSASSSGAASVPSAFRRRPGSTGDSALRSARGSHLPREARLHCKKALP